MVIWKITTGKSTNFTFRIVTNPTYVSQWSHWTFIFKRQFMPYLEWTKFSARRNRYFFHFQIYLFPLSTLNSLFILCMSFSALQLFKFGRVWCDFLVHLLTIFNNSFSLKNSPYSFLLFSLVLCIPLYSANLSCDMFLLQYYTQASSVTSTSTLCLAELDILTAHTPYVIAYCTIKSSDHYYFTSRVCKEAMLWYGGQNSCPKGQRRGLWSHTVWGSLACCFDLDAGGLQPAYNFLMMNIHQQECCEEFRLTFDRKILKATSFQRKGRKNLKHSLS